MWGSGRRWLIAKDRLDGRWFISPPRGWVQIDPEPAEFPTGAEALAAFARGAA